MIDRDKFWEDYREYMDSLSPEELEKMAKENEVWDNALSDGLNGEITYLTCPECGNITVDVTYCGGLPDETGDQPQAKEEYFCRECFHKWNSLGRV